MVLSTKSSLTMISSSIFRSRLVLYSAPSINLGLAALASKTLRVADRQTGHADPHKRLAHGVELRRLDDGQNQLHRSVCRAWVVLRRLFAGDAITRGQATPGACEIANVDLVSGRLAASSPEGAARGVRLCRAVRRS